MAAEGSLKRGGVPTGAEATAPATEVGSTARRGLDTEMRRAGSRVGFNQSIVGCDIVG